MDINGGLNSIIAIITHSMKPSPNLAGSKTERIPKVTRHVAGKTG